MPPFSAHRRLRGRYALTRLTLALVAVALAIACRSDRAVVPEAPSGTKLLVCHREALATTIGEIYLSEFPEHASHGDYVARLEVNPAVPTGDSVHYARITDALAAARASRVAHKEGTTAACRITITVAAGTFTGSTSDIIDPAETFPPLKVERFPLVIDVPDISIIGALKMAVDAGGRATGVGETSAATTLVANPALAIVGGSSSQTGVSEELFVVNAHPDGPEGERTTAGDGAIIEGLVLQNGRAKDATVTGGQGVLSMRVRNLTIRGNRFEGSFTEAIDLRVSTALVDRNYLSGLGNACDICLQGPGDYDARNNRLLGPGGIPGFLTVPAMKLPVPSQVEQYEPPSTALITVALTNNEVRGHLAKPVGVGIRIGAIGINAPNVAGTTKAILTGNTVAGNTFGVIFEAAFPVAGGTLRGDMEVKTSDNTISQSCQNDLLVSFTRHASGLGLSSPYPSYLKNSTYAFTSSDLPWDKTWVANPSGYGNAFILNGQTMPNATATAYNAARVCP